MDRTPHKKWRRHPLNSEDDQLARWYDHFNEPLNFGPTKPHSQDQSTMSSPSKPVWISTEPPNDETIAAIKAFKSNKASGTDNKPADIKNGCCYK